MLTYRFLLLELGSLLFALLLLAFALLQKSFRDKNIVGGSHAPTIARAESQNGLMV